MKAGPTPASVNALSIIGIVLSSLALLFYAGIGTVVYAAGARGVPWGGGSPREIYAIASQLLSAMFWLLLLVASIGCLSLQKWARICMLVYAWGMILLEVAQAGVVVFTLGIPTRTGSIEPPFFLLLAAGMMLLQMAYPVCVVIFFTRRRVREAFNGIFTAWPANFPLVYPQGNEGR